jgi:hypothetical protein
MAGQLTTNTNKPGRRALSPEERVAQATAALQAAKLAAKDADKHRSEVVGDAIRAEAESDPAFRKAVIAILRRRVTGKVALAAITPLLMSGTDTETVVPIVSAEPDNRSAA